MSFLSRSIGLMVIVLLLSQCQKSKNNYSPTPYLKISDLSITQNDSGKDSFIMVKMVYRDGDGDIGLEDNDTLAPFNYGSRFFYNLLVDYYVMKNGVWIKPLNPLAPTDTIVFHERLPSITPGGKQKWIEGNLDLRLPANPFSLKPDTVRFEIQLVDRSLKKSEILRTETLTLKH